MENMNRLIYPTIYDQSIIISEYAGIQLDCFNYSQVLEVQGIRDLHDLCTISDSVTAIKAATLAIDKYNKKYNTKLTYECCKNLLPSFATFSGLNDPIVYCEKSKGITLRKRICQVIEEYGQIAKGIDFNTINAIFMSIYKEDLDCLLVFYPNYFVLYKSCFERKLQMAEDSDFGMSDLLPIAGIGLSNRIEHCYALPPTEEASLKHEVYNYTNSNHEYIVPKFF